MRETGAIMARMRKTQGLSQERLAEMARIHVNTISNVERGIGDPSVIVLSLILTRLGCPGLQFDDIGFHPWEPTLGAGDATAIEPMTKSYIAAEIGTTIRGLRLDRGLSLRTFADEASIHINTIWNVENGLVASSSFAIYRLYRALGTSCIKARGSSIEVL